MVFLVGICFFLSSSSFSFESQLLGLIGRSFGRTLVWLVWHGLDNFKSFEKLLDMQKIVQVKKQSTEYCNPDVATEL